MFRSRRGAEEVSTSYATRSGGGHGRHDEWPRREVREVVRHATAYNDQKRRLDAMVAKHGKTSDDMFIPTVFVVRHDDGSACTGTTWTQNVPSMLPVSDVVLLCEQPAAPSAPFLTVRVRWDVLAHLCADASWKVQPAFKPVRVLTLRWPSPDQFAELTQAALVVETLESGPGQSNRR